MDYQSIAKKFITYTQQHIFLTGKAGTGKTTFLQQIKSEIHKKYVVLAPTGVAAINAGGVTIHSFFQLHFGIFLPHFRSGWGNNDSPIINTQQLLSRLKYNANKKKLIQELELLIIDEISMVRADIIDAIDIILQHTRKKVGIPFGGVQLLLIGDLFQLPPVVRDEEKRIMAETYNSPFFFDALAFKNEQPLYIELQKIHRQTDETFIHLLNTIRSGRCGNHELEILEEYYNPLFTGHYNEKIITLTTHNAIADDINKQELLRIDKPTIALKAKVEGEFPEQMYPIDTTLQFKVGAQVMFIKNDKGENRKYYNGKLATIEAIDEENKQIIVSFENEKGTYTLEQEVWNNIRFRFDEQKNSVEEEIIGTFTQFPIKLAWAVTIHKSQGLTFDKAIIDAGKAFAPGQVYVALSRLRSLEGLVLKSLIKPESITTDPLILEYTLQQLSSEELLRVLKFAQANYIEQQIAAAYNFTKILDIFYNIDQAYTALAFYNETTVAEAKLKFQECLFEIAQTGFQFEKQLHQLFKKTPLDYNFISDRITKANGWFQDKIINQLLTSLETLKSEANKFSKSKKFFQDILVLKKKIIYQHALTDQSSFYITCLMANLDPDAILSEGQKLYQFEKVVAAALQQDASSEQTEKLASHDITYKMYIEGKSIPEIAAERQMVVSTIESHLLKFIATGGLSVKIFLDDNKLQTITSYINQHPEQNLTAIKASLGDAVSFTEIRAALEYLQYKSLVDKK
jgi:uncharacterized protein YpbB